MHRKNFTEFHLRKTQMLINIGHKIGVLINIRDRDRNSILFSFCFAGKF